MSPAPATVGDRHICLSFDGGLHVGGEIQAPCSPTQTYGGKAAARLGDEAACRVGPNAVITHGSSSVWADCLPVARVGDLTSHVGVISSGVSTVEVGGESIDALQAAIVWLGGQDFAKTREGRRVLAKIDALNADGHIEFRNLPANFRGQWDAPTLVINSSAQYSVHAIVSELVHEATHAVDEDQYPSATNANSVDEEIHTNTNQLDVYEQQRGCGFSDPELETRRNERNNGTLRDYLRNLYNGNSSGFPEHRGLRPPSILP